MEARQGAAIKSLRTRGAVSELLESSFPVAAPFDAIATTYDDAFSNSSTGRVQRRLVWIETDRIFRAGQRILEINCGTGIDALHLASRGIEVIACDSAPGMIAVAQHRLKTSPIRTAVDFRCLWSIIRRYRRCDDCSRHIFVWRAGEAWASRCRRRTSRASRFDSQGSSSSQLKSIRGLADARAFELWQTTWF